MHFLKFIWDKFPDWSQFHCQAWKVQRHTLGHFQLSYAAIFLTNCFRTKSPECFTSVGSKLCTSNFVWASAFISMHWASKSFLYNATFHSLIALIWSKADVPFLYLIFVVPQQSTKPLKVQFPAPRRKASFFR